MAAITQWTGKSRQGRPSLLPRPQSPPPVPDARGTLHGAGARTRRARSRTSSVTTTLMEAAREAVDREAAPRSARRSASGPRRLGRAGHGRGLPRSSRDSSALTKKSIGYGASSRSASAPGSNSAPTSAGRAPRERSGRGARRQSLLRGGRRTSAVRGAETPGSPWPRNASAWGRPRARSQRRSGRRAR